MALLCVSTAGYLGLTLLAAWQALRGQPVIAPDALTLWAFTVLVVSIVVVAGGITITARRTIE